MSLVLKQIYCHKKKCVTKELIAKKTFNVSYLEGEGTLAIVAVTTDVAEQIA